MVHGWRERSLGGRPHRFWPPPAGSTAGALSDCAPVAERPVVSQDANSSRIPTAGRSGALLTAPFRALPPIVPAPLDQARAPGSARPDGDSDEDVDSDEVADSDEDADSDWRYD